MLKRQVARADTTGMIDIALDELADVAHWRNLLIAYRRQQADARQLDPERAGWVPRITSLDGLPGDELSQLHGRLIALGLLAFELEGRSSGMSYQVTPLGLRALSGPIVPDSDDDSEQDADEADSLAA